MPPGLADDVAEGPPKPPSIVERAQEALRSATTSPAQAERTARTVERAALEVLDWRAASIARRARGVAFLQLRRLDDAIGELRGAVSAAGNASDRQLAAEAQVSLASALVLRGLPDEGFAAIGEALTVLTGIAGARAHMQRAGMLLEMGHFDDALVDFRIALPVVRRAGDARGEVQILSNRSMIFNSRRQFSAAESDLRRAQEICAAHDIGLYGAYIEQNLGCVLADRGDVPAALAQFDSAATRYQGIGMNVGSLHLDRSKLLLAVRLVSEARAEAEQAVRAFLEQHREVHVPEAQLMLSTAALLQNDHATAVAAAQSASRRFASLGKTEWLTLSRYALVQARVAAAEAAERSTGAVDPRRRGALIRRLRESASALHGAGWLVPALDARIVAAVLALNGARPALARQELALAARARRSGPADVRSRAWLAEALLRDSEGSTRGARSALRAGLRVVEDHRASMGASELRASVSVHRGALARAGLRIALRGGSASEVHWWAERGRASANEPRPARPPEDEVLAHLLQDLRATVAETEEARLSGSPAGPLLTRQVELERQILQRSRESASGVGVHASEPPHVDVLAEHLGDAAYVEYVGLDDQLFAVSIVGGRPRLHALGADAELRHSLGHLPFALRRLAHPHTRANQLAAATSVVNRAVTAISQTLFAPLAAVIGDRRLTIVPTSWLQTVPWSIIPACAGRPVSLAPSTALWHAAVTRSDHPGGRIAAVAGPGLSAASREARGVAELHPGASLLSGPLATAEATAAAIDGASVVHVAAHGTIRSDNPLFSSILLADGPYTVYDIERLAATPHHVVLAACNTALSQVTADVEILGLSAALLRQETATLVAPVVPIPDAETYALMIAYHRGLRSGRGPAEALAQAQVEQSRDGTRARASAAGFVCLGSGDRPPFPQ